MVTKQHYNRKSTNPTKHTTRPSRALHNPAQSQSSISSTNDDQKSIRTSARMNIWIVTRLNSMLTIWSIAYLIVSFVMIWSWPTTMHYLGIHKLCGDSIHGTFDAPNEILSKRHTLDLTSSHFLRLLLDRVSIFGPIPTTTTSEVTRMYSHMTICLNMEFRKSVAWVYFSNAIIGFGTVHIDDWFHQYNISNNNNFTWISIVAWFQFSVAVALMYRNIVESRFGDLSGDDKYYSTIRMVASEIDVPMRYLQYKYVIFCVVYIYSAFQIVTQLLMVHISCGNDDDTFRISGIDDDYTDDNYRKKAGGYVAATQQQQQRQLHHKKSRCIAIRNCLLLRTFLFMVITALAISVGTLVSVFLVQLHINNLKTTL